MSLEAAIAGRLDDIRLAVAMLIEMHLPGETVYAWTGSGSLDWNGITWQGDARLTNFDKIGHDLDGGDNKVTFRLAFDDRDPALCALRDGQGRGGAIMIDMVFFDAVTNAALGAEPCFIGEIDSCAMTASSGGGTGRRGSTGGPGGSAGGVGAALTMTLSGSSETALLRRSTQHMLTDGAQQQIFPGDKGLEFATQPQTTKFGGGRTAYGIGGPGGVSARAGTIHLH